MSSINASTMLAYLAGAAFFVCAAMAVYWSLRRVPPGFGLWNVSYALVGVGCLLLADSERFPRSVVILMAPALILAAAMLRLEGLRLYFGSERQRDWVLLLLSVAAVSLISVFTYAWDDAAARSMVTSAGVTLVLVSMTIVALGVGRRSRSKFLRPGAVLFLVYGGLWLSSGIHWLTTGSGFPLGELDTHSTVFFAGATAFEFFGLIGALVLSARWNAEALEAAHGITEEERRQLADIVAFLPDATFALDREGKVAAWNRAAEERTGIKAPEVVGTSVCESLVRASMDDSITLSEVLLDPSKSVPARYRDVRFDTDSLSGEKEWHHPTTPGKSGHFWHLAALLRNADGDVTGAIESVRDVTSRVQAAEAVRESEERYRSLFDHSLDGILVIAPGGAVVDANPSACRMLGMTRQEICDSAPGSLISRADETGSDPQEQLELGSALRERDFVRGDGSTFPAECMSVVWNDSVGHLRAFVQFRDVSERVEAQDILRASEKRLSRDGAVPYMGIWEIDLVGRNIWLSPGAMRLFGMSDRPSYFPVESEVLTTLAEQPAILKAELERVAAQGGSYDLEYFITRDDDQVLRKVRSVGAAVMGPEGVPVKVVGVTQDITDSQGTPAFPPPDLYFTEHSDDQVYWVDPDGRIVNVNQAACAQLGYSREELLAMTIYELNPALPSGTAETLDTVKAASRRHETIHRTKDGRDMPVELIVTYAMYGGAEYKFVVARDISERKRLEENLQRTQLSLGRGGDAIMWVDEGGQFAFATEAACEKSGFSREEILAMNVQDLDLIASEDWRSVWRELLEYGSLAIQTSYRTKGGDEARVDAVLNHVEHDGRGYALVVLNDLSEQQADTSASSDVDLSLLRHQELEAVGQLAGGIAHDFNSLLTAIIGYGDLMLAGEDAQNVDALRRDAAEIRNAAERAASLTSQILAFARRQPLRPRRVDLAEFVGGLELHLKELLAADVTLAMEAPRENGVVEVDTEQFERVVVNLVTNASEAMPTGGHVDIGVESVDLSEEYCRAYPELKAGAYVVLSVSDTGVGMDAATRQHIFEPFFTTKSPGEGPGLGLSVVYGIVRQSGGTVVAYSEVGRGSTMKVYLPRLVDDRDLASPTPAPMERSGANGETIIVVEDEPPLRRLIARVLGQAGYVVFVAGNGPEALELFEDMVEAPDLLVTDVILPGALRGNDLAREFSSEVPGLPVLYISGHPRDAIMHEGRLDEGVFFLGKPFTPQRLSEKVREILGGNAPASDVSAG